MAHINKNAFIGLTRYKDKVEDLSDLNHCKKHGVR